MKFQIIVIPLKSISEGIFNMQPRHRSLLMILRNIFQFIYKAFAQKILQELLNSVSLRRLFIVD